MLHGVLTVNTLNWCTLRNSAVSAAGLPRCHLQPVTWKVLPKLDTMNAAAKPANARRSGARRRQTPCVPYTSSLMSRMSVEGRAGLRAGAFPQPSDGGAGVVRAVDDDGAGARVMAALILAKSGRKVPGVRARASPCRRPARCWARSCRSRGRARSPRRPVHDGKDGGDDGLRGTRR